METELLTADEVARRLHLKSETIRRWARAGRIPSLRPSPKVIRFNWRAVCEALEAACTHFAISSDNKSDRPGSSRD